MLFLLLGWVPKALFRWIPRSIWEVAKLLWCLFVSWHSWEESPANNYCRCIKKKCKRCIVWWIDECGEHFYY